MHKYVIEDSINFMDLLNNSLDEETTQDSDNNCLISYTPLDKQHITLTCGHKFNYKPIFNDVSQQKILRFGYGGQQLHINQFRCPYCRTVQEKLLPNINGYDKIRGVNTPIKYCMFMNKCQYIFKSGKQKGCVCNKNTNNDYCCLHAKQSLVHDKMHTCSMILKSGPRKGEPCGLMASCVGGLCNRHNKLNTNKKK